MESPFEGGIRGSARGSDMQDSVAGALLGMSSTGLGSYLGLAASAGMGKSGIRHPMYGDRGNSKPSVTEEIIALRNKVEELEAKFKIVDDFNLRIVRLKEMCKEDPGVEKDVNKLLALLAFDEMGDPVK
jgi:hypothetical protein